MSRGNTLRRLLSDFNLPDGRATFPRTGSGLDAPQSASKLPTKKMRGDPTHRRSSSDFIRPDGGRILSNMAPHICFCRIACAPFASGMGRGQALASMVVGFQSARWDGNIFLDGLGLRLAPSRKQAHRTLNTQRSDPLPIVVRFHTGGREADFSTWPRRRASVGSHAHHSLLE